ncbi:MAG: hypothetical protein WC516_09110 [Patescibacteria group bacterium]|jgi:hypothetical protein
MKKIPCFVCKTTSIGKKIKYRTRTSDGKLVELELWDLVNKYGADRVLQMREEFPEIEEEK